MDRAWRPQVDLQESLAVPFSATALRNGTNASTLAYKFVCDGARLAAQGYGHLLPEAAAPRGSVGPRTKAIRWKQGRAEFEGCRYWIESVGSSVVACVRVGALEYLDADGNIVEMNWPPKSAVRVAA